MADDHSRIMQIIRGLRSQRERLSIIHRTYNNKKSNDYLLECSLLDDLLKALNGDLCLIKQDDFKQASRNELDWTALIVEAYGEPTAVIYSNMTAASRAYEAFVEKHGDSDYGEINIETERVNLDRLSDELIWSSLPRTAYALISVAGGNFSISLCGTIEEAESMADVFKEEAAEFYARDDAYCSWIAVALPRIKLEASG